MTDETGLQEGVPCTFPFKVDGTTYNGCTREGGHIPWCSTKTDSNGDHNDGACRPREAKHMNTRGTPARRGEETGVPQRRRCRRGDEAPPTHLTSHHPIAPHFQVRSKLDGNHGQWTSCYSVNAVILFAHSCVYAVACVHWSA